MSLKVLVIDDHPLVQAGVSAALVAFAADITVMSAADAEHGLAATAAHPDLDLVLLDLALPGMSGFSLIGKLHERRPWLPVVVLSALEEPETVRQAISAGAMGFVPKSAAPRVLIEALQRALTASGSGLQQSATTLRAVSGSPGGQPARSQPNASMLTLRQVEVLTGICEGKTNKQIATELGLSEKTVKAHVTSIFKLLGVVNRTQAVLAARRTGMTAA